MQGRDRQQGMTAVELVVVMALAVSIIGISAVVSLRALGREAARGALYEVQVLAQRARVEAASRNRECRLLLNTATRRVLVVDTMGTGTTADDIELARSTLGSNVQFHSPEAGAPVTLQDLGGAWFGTTFDSNGTVVSGTGSITLQGQDRHSRLTLFAAGGSEATSWNGSAWTRGKY